MKNVIHIVFVNRYILLALFLLHANLEATRHKNYWLEFEKEERLMQEKAEKENAYILHASSLHATASGNGGKNHKKHITPQTVIKNYQHNKPLFVQATITKNSYKSLLLFSSSKPLYLLHHSLIFYH